MTTRYTIKITISSDEIDNIVEQAATGITYWADGFKLRGKQEAEFEMVSEALTHGRSIMIHDIETDRWYTLTLKKLLKALGDTSDLNFDEYDWAAADGIIQTALFGEIVYG